MGAQIETYDRACSAARRVEDFVDFSHFPWVHPGILGDRSKPLSPEHEVRDDGTTISFDVALEEPQASVKGDAAPGAKVQREPTTYTLHLPLSVTLDQRLPDGHRFLLFLACSPVGDRRGRSFTWNARTYKLEPDADAELAAFRAVILDQDRPIAESQRPEELPVDLSAELHIAGPDRASIVYWRRLAELAASRP
jgi:vanillate O-demethylase monooxygenase subunit